MPVRSKWKEEIPHQVRDEESGVAADGGSGSEAGMRAGTKGTIKNETIYDIYR